MDQKLVTLVIILAVIGSAAGLFAFYSLSSVPETEIVCPKDGSHYIWTSVGSRSENFKWICLQRGQSWTKTYPQDVYEIWRN